MVNVNAVYLPLYNVRRRYVVVYGGRRSGKSVAVSQLLVRRALEHKRNIGVVRKVANTIRLSVWERILKAIDEAIGLEYCKINKSDRTIELKPSGSQFIFFGLDDPHKIKSIEDITDYWIEEATELNENDFDTLDVGLSASVKPMPQVWLTFNPIPEVPGYEHWLRERFLDHAVERHGELKLNKIYYIKNAAVLRTWYKSNRYCPKKTVEILEGYKKNNPELWQMWGLGKFTKLKGVIFDNWDIVRKVPEGVPLIGYGLDFGFANDPAAVVRVWKHNDDVYLEEVVYSSGLTNPQLSAIMQERGVERDQEIVGDSAEPKSIRELQNLGWFVTPADKSPDYKRSAIQYIRGLKLHILSNSVNLKKEIATYSWRQDKDGNILPVPQDGNDHLIDAMIYKLYKRRNKWGIL